jgi:hypothetical protein
MVTRLCRHAIMLICTLFLGMQSVGGHSVTQTADASPDDVALVEHSSDVFFGMVDIVTAGAAAPGSIEYTILTTQILKGDLAVPSLIVMRQEAGEAGNSDGVGYLDPMAEYLFFTRYDPVLLRYVVTAPVAGTMLVTSPEQRAALVAIWTSIVAQTACLVTDVLTLDGVIYARRDWNDKTRYIARDRVGATIATVAARDTAATGCRADLADRSASMIPAGTKIQALKGYVPAFRVAIRLRDGHRYLYEAIWSETARTGADLLDISGRATSLEIACGKTAECTGERRTISDRSQIERVVALLLDAPANPGWVEWRGYPTQRARLSFTLDDGSTVTVRINGQTGMTQSGIRVPVDELIALVVEQ